VTTSSSRSTHPVLHDHTPRDWIGVHHRSPIDLPVSGGAAGSPRVSAGRRWPALDDATFEVSSRSGTGVVAFLAAATTAPCT